MMLSQPQAAALLKKYGICQPKTLVLRNGELGNVKRWRFPAVLKVDSPEIIHKSDFGLVFAGLTGMREVEEKAMAAARILARKKVRNYNFVLQEQASGVELIFGMKRDATFGPVILFGIGGFLAEIVDDVSMGIAPLSAEDCAGMIDSIRGRKILDGYRNIRKADRKQLVRLLMSLSRLSLKEKDVSEIDFNPVIANGKKLVVADARIIKNA